MKSPIMQDCDIIFLLRILQISLLYIEGAKNKYENNKVFFT